MALAVAVDEVGDRIAALLQPQPEQNVVVAVEYRNQGQASFGLSRVSASAHPKAHAIGNRVVVEIICRMMAKGGVAIADEDEGAGPRFQHEGEILAPHDRRTVGIDIPRARHVAARP